MALSIFTTYSDPEIRGDLYKEAMENYHQLADEVVGVDGSLTPKPESKVCHEWPEEFEWKFIGEQFQRGYEACTGDWVIRADLDFFFHEDDMYNIRQILDKCGREAVTFWKYQIFTPGMHNLKSRLVIAVNKGKFGDRIRFDGGGDLCQPTLDGKYIDPRSVPEIRIPVYNYDEITKTREQLMKQKGRFARAWHRTFNEYKLGGPDDESAYDKWYKMVKGRFTKHSPISNHPRVIRPVLENLTPDQFGYSGFGLC